MKRIEIKNVKIDNFKGIANGDFVFNGENTEIVADVMQGKSTIKDAYFFCLGIDVPNFFPVDKNNNLIDGVETIVELILVKDGIEYKLKRMAKTKYKINKDTGVKTFDGFKKDMFEFDGIPCGATEFKNKLVSLFCVEDFETLKVLSVLNYFNEQLDWKSRRALIYNLYVDNSLIDGLKNCDKYELIGDELKKGRTANEISSLLNSESNKIAEEKGANHILLMSAQNEVAEYSKIDFSLVEKELEDIDKEIEEFNNDKLVREIAKLSAEKTKAEYENLDKIERINSEITSIKKDLNSHIDYSKELENSIEYYTNKYYSAKNSTKDCFCSVCKQPLPKEIKENELKNIKNIVLETQKTLENIKSVYENKKLELLYKEKEREKLENSKEIKEISENIELLKQELAIKIDENRKNELKKRKTELIIDLGNRKIYENAKEKVALYAKQRAEIIEREIVLLQKKKALEEYTLDTIKLVNESINSKFNGVKFKLFEVLTATAKNDIKPTLVVTNNGIDYCSCSTGQKAEVNMNIVCTLQKTFGVSLPIWVDDASITNFKRLPENQLIMLLNEKGRALNCTKIKDIY